MTDLLLPHVGDNLTFKEIDDKFRRDNLDPRGLPNSGFMRPNGKNKLPRAIFAKASLNGFVDDLLFVGDINGKYRPNIERLLNSNISIWIFRRINDRDVTWRVVGEAKIEALLLPSANQLKEILANSGHRLKKEGDLWQLLNEKNEPQFKVARSFSYAVHLSYKNQRSNFSYHDDDEIGRRVNREVLVRLDQDKLRALLLRKYSGCVVSGLAHGGKLATWIEAAHINDDKNDEMHFRYNTLNNGLLLRSDLHRLFDAHFLSINPDSGVVELFTRDTEVLEHYKDINRNKCKLWDEVQSQVNMRFLRKHYQASKKKFPS